MHWHVLIRDLPSVWASQLICYISLYPRMPPMTAACIMLAFLTLLPIKICITKIVAVQVNSSLNASTVYNELRGTEISKQAPCAVMVRWSQTHHSRLISGQRIETWARQREWNGKDARTDHPPLKLSVRARSWTFASTLVKLCSCKCNETFSGFCNLQLQLFKMINNALYVVPFFSLYRGHFWNP